MPAAMRVRALATIPALILLAAMPASAHAAGETATGKAATELRTLANVNFDGLASGTTISQTESGSPSGSGLSARLVAANGGRATTTAATGGATRNAARFPRFAGSGAGVPKAVMSIANTGDSDALDVGAADFTWQADFSLDQESGTTSGDGDSVFQRGTYVDDEAQWKLTADRRAVRCQIRFPGMGLTSYATPPVRIPAGDTSWYRASCSRVGPSLTLTVKRWNAAGKAWQDFEKPTTVALAAKTPALTFNPAVPASIGGKLWAADRIVLSSTDQFNGMIDNATVSVATPAATTGPESVVSVNFDEVSAGANYSTVRARGSAAPGISSRFVALNGGRATALGSPNAVTGRAARLPAYRLLGATTPRAVLSIANTGASDAMDIGSANFTWQADIALDANLGSDPSDGDNVFQRGLYTSGKPQWKLQADRRTLRCSIRFPNAGLTSYATPGVRIPPGDTSWYRAVCGRFGSRLSLNVKRWNPATAAWETYQQPTSVALPRDPAPLTFDATVPVAVGGKLSSSTAIARDTDQLNGRVDNVRLIRY